MADLGKLLLRLAVGGLMLPHGIHKLIHGISGLVTGLQNRGVPGFMAYGVWIGEVAAPILIVLGVYTRAAACLLIINMLVAVWWVHDFFSFTNTGGHAMEVAFLYLFGAAAIALLGGGRYSLSRGAGSWN